ncbi:hypothetical protein GXP70_01835 [Paenibacillus lycopersici]|uniref:Uncharacterized protein n=1 Tax=Paenibacillus lycopersici TaxID=2704462 RepID=A0A6C0FU02_9BACL|nr:hypothetical protein [Paenibacillus lycopersici]QHT58843.1 hypothetical protein GXP70_01835 [Paenibacillus lycopersici]
MNSNVQYAVSVVQQFIPYGAELAALSRHGGMPAVLFADIDYDFNVELLALYRYQGEQSLIVLKNNGGHWRMFAHADGKGVYVADVSAAPVARAGQNSILIGWQHEDGEVELDILHWTGAGLKRIVPDGIAYDWLEIEDMPAANGPDGKCELALWLQDSEQSYRIETYRCEESGGLVPAADVHPYYFSKVAYYYEQLAHQQPNVPLYRSVLDDALQRAGGSGADSDPAPAPEPAAAFAPEGD